MYRYKTKATKLIKKGKEMEKVYYYSIFLEQAKMSYKLVYTND